MNLIFVLPMIAGCIFLCVGLWICHQAKISENLFRRSVNGSCKIPETAGVLEEGDMQFNRNSLSGDWEGLPCRFTQLEVQYGSEHVHLKDVTPWITFQQLGYCGQLGICASFDEGCNACKNCTDYLSEYQQRLPGFDCNFVLDRHDSGLMAPDAQIQVGRKKEAKQSLSIDGIFGPVFTGVGSLVALASFVAGVYEVCKAAQAREANPASQYYLLILSLQLRLLARWWPWGSGGFGRRCCCLDHCFVRCLDSVQGLTF